MKIDSHQHFWKYDPVRDAWIDESMEAIQRDFLPKDLRPKLQKNGVDGCISIQADQSEKETHFLLDLADKYDFIKGVVGWVDLKSPEIDERLEYFSQFPKLKGFRHIIQAEPDGFMTDEIFIRNVNKLQLHQLSYDILIFENQLNETIQFVQRLPEVRLVIDHIAKPVIKESSFEQWATYMKKLASYQNVHVKLSGMVTEADWDHWQKKDFEPYIETCLEHFGADRLMFGSDWPVCLLAAGYDEVVGIVEDFIVGLSETEREDIMGKTAQKFYLID